MLGVVRVPPQAEISPAPPSEQGLAARLHSVQTTVGEGGAALIGSAFCALWHTEDGATRGRMNIEAECRDGGGGRCPDPFVFIWGRPFAGPRRGSLPRSPVFAALAGALGLSHHQAVHRSRRLGRGGRALRLRLRLGARSPLAPSRARARSHIQARYEAISPVELPVEAEETAERLRLMGGGCFAVSLAAAPALPPDCDSRRQPLRRQSAEQ